ncbi:MAG: SAM-dependent methyltransferase [Treponema sp.]|nr:SAM-dependent methyltransferase [Treponema sp.]
MQFRIEKIPGKVFIPFNSLDGYLENEFLERFSINFSNAYTPNTFSKEDFTTALLSKKICKIVTNSSSLFYTPDTFSKEPYFARCVLREPFLLHFDSIGDAANALKSLQRNWAPYSFNFFRRTSLIQEKLPYINLKARQFPCNVPKSKIGCYTLLDEHTLLASAETNSFLPGGAIEFVENHTEPPSRAYLKLQEALMMMKIFFEKDFPASDEKCFDAGACPGGWTWVLLNQGCKVFAVDRSELTPTLMQNKNVTFLKHDAFTLKPEEVGYCDWIFSDVICYPERLYEWVQVWLESALCKNMVCTIKMQGVIDWSLVEKFDAIPHSKVVHLNYNKHELTWLHCENCEL